MRRRVVLQTLASACVLARIPRTGAQPVTDPDRAAFLALSAILTGRTALDPGLAQRLYSALVADDAAIATSIRALLAFMEERKIEPLGVQSALDAGHSPLAPLPAKIATAWLMGIVGSGATARCIAYEDALDNVIVADVLKPPTYCYGPYGSWARKPI